MNTQPFFPIALYILPEPYAMKFVKDRYEATIYRRYWIYAKNKVTQDSAYLKRNGILSLKSFATKKCKIEIQKLVADSKTINAVLQNNLPYVEPFVSNIMSYLHKHPTYIPALLPAKMKNNRREIWTEWYMNTFHENSSSDKNDNE